MLNQMEIVNLMWGKLVYLQHEDEQWWSIKKHIHLHRNSSTVLTRMETNLIWTKKYIQLCKIESSKNFLINEYLNIIKPRCHFWLSRRSNAACRRVMAKQSLNKRSTKMEWTLLDKESKARAHQGTWKILKSGRNFRKWANQNGEKRWNSLKRQHLWKSLKVSILRSLPMLKNYKPLHVIKNTSIWWPLILPYVMG